LWPTVPSLICDLHGVLFSDAPQRRLDAWRDANGGVLGVTSPGELEDDALRAFRTGALGEREYAAHLRDRLGWTGGDDELARLWGSGGAVVLEVVEVLARLRERGWQLIAVHETDPWTLRHRTEQFGWAVSLFERVVRDGEVGAHRPDPRFFAELLRGLPRHGPRLYVDADSRNVSAARRAGLDGHLFSGAASLQGACGSMMAAAR
jgi:FMN phosphatase YigB (HAD superfamily)